MALPVLHACQSVATKGDDTAAKRPEEKKEKTPHRKLQGLSKKQKIVKTLILTDNVHWKH